MVAYRRATVKKQKVRKDPLATPERGQETGSARIKNLLSESLIPSEARGLDLAGPLA